jgi:LacI family transcriptional regulator
MIENSPATIKDVAKMAGVSIGTVDRVLHDRGRVSQDNKKKVFAAIEKLSYSPSQIARALSVRKNEIKIGITYPKVDAFWSEIDEGVKKAQDHLEPFGVRLIVEVSHSYDLSEQLASIDKLLKQEVKGILLTAVDDYSADSIERNIPETIPYATVINKTMGPRCLFHMGPDDFLLGQLAAKLVDLYCPADPNVLILTPNAQFTGSQQRVAGFCSKVNQELTNIRILRIDQVQGLSDQEICKNVYAETVQNLSKISSLNAIYITNGFFDHVAEAIKDNGLVGKAIVIGHEYCSNLQSYFDEGLVSATIYQHPAQQWYLAIQKLYELLINNTKPNQNKTKVQCSILMKETLPFIRNAGEDLF